MKGDAMKGRLVLAEAGQGFRTSLLIGTVVSYVPREKRLILKDAYKIGFWIPEVGRGPRDILDIASDGFAPKTGVTGPAPLLVLEDVRELAIPSKTCKKDWRKVLSDKQRRA